LETTFNNCAISGIFFYYTASLLATLRYRRSLTHYTVRLSVCPVPVPFTERADTPLCRCAV